MAEGASGPPSLEEVRKRIDAIDAELLRLVDERAGLAKDVAAAKAAADILVGKAKGRGFLLRRFPVNARMTLLTFYPFGNR